MPFNVTALLDACVIYPAPLRDLLVQLALSDLFRAKWTEQIHQEWIGNVLKKRPDITPAQLERTRELMNLYVRDCLVTGFEPLIPSLMLPDPDDRHVLAAAIASRSDIIITFNLKDFPEQVLSAYRIKAQHPDEFVSTLLEQEPQAVKQAVETVRQRLRNPPKSIEEYLDILKNQQLRVTVSMLKRMESEFEKG